MMTTRRVAHIATKRACATSNAHIACGVSPGSAGAWALSGCVPSTPCRFGAGHRARTPPSGASWMRLAHTTVPGLEGHLGEQAKDEIPLGELLRPNPACVLPDFDPRARCVVVHHGNREPAWQERSQAVQKVLESRREETPPMFMVVVIKGKQYKLTMDDIVASETIDGVDINDRVRMDGVLLVGSKDWTVVGTPHVPTASLILQCEEHTKTSKIWVFKKKRRKGYARSRGHRQKLTMLRVVRMDFDLDELVAMEDQQERLASVEQEQEAKDK